jgi:hypothetical protein
VVGGEEWGGVAREGEEYFVEHFASGLRAMRIRFKKGLRYILCGFFPPCSGLVEEVLDQ